MLTNANTIYPLRLTIYYFATDVTKTQADNKKVWAIPYLLSLSTSKLLK